MQLIAQWIKKRTCRLIRHTTTVLDTYQFFLFPDTTGTLATITDVFLGTNISSLS